MIIKELSKLQREDVYHQHMRKDFHPSEVKPLSMMERLIEEGRYLCFGIYKEQTDQLLGYAYFAKADYKLKPILVLDFFAVVSTSRSKGFGSKFLKEMKKDLGDKYSAILAEVENPNHAIDEENRDLRKRRINFYHRNGFKTSKVLSRVQMDEYQILVLNLEEPLTDEEAFDIMSRTYRSLYGQEFYDMNIWVGYKTNSKNTFLK